MPDVGQQFGSNVVYVPLCEDGSCRMAFPQGEQTCPFVTYHPKVDLIYCKRFRVELQKHPLYYSEVGKDSLLAGKDSLLVVFRRCDQCKEGLRKLEVLAKVPRESRRKK